MTFKREMAIVRLAVRMRLQHQADTDLIKKLRFLLWLHDVPESLYDTLKEREHDRLN